MSLSRTIPQLRVLPGTANLPRSTVPYAALGLLAAFMQLVGGSWDVAWHVALGRDTFWSPPHLLIYAGVLLLLGIGVAGLRALRSAGFAVATLGPLAQIAAAPFDELWHQLFGVDVTIWSPPHLVLIAGMALAPLGLALAIGPEIRARLAGARPVAIGLFVVALTVSRGALGELGSHVWTRDPFLYPILAGLLVMPFLLAAALVLGQRFGASSVALLYAALEIGLGTVFYTVFPHYHPPAPPLMLLLPALAIDLAVVRRPNLGWRDAAALGLAFGPLFLALDAPVSHLSAATQWPEYAASLATPLPDWAPRPQLRLAMPWALGLVPVAVLLGSVAGLAGSLLGWRLARVGISNAPLARQR